MGLILEGGFSGGASMDLEPQLAPLGDGGVRFSVVGGCHPIDVGPDAPSQFLKECPSKSRCDAAPKLFSSRSASSRHMNSLIRWELIA